MADNNTYRFSPEFGSAHSFTPEFGSTYSFTPEFRSYAVMYMRVSYLKLVGDEVVAVYSDGTESTIGIVGDFPIHIDSIKGWTATEPTSGNVVLTEVD